MFENRKIVYQQLEENRNSKVLVYFTGDRPGLETQIHPEVLDYFVNHLDKMGVVGKISLVLYTRGGNTLAAWSLVNLIRQFCDDFEVLIPSKCLSSGTIMSLGANRIIMTKQATLGPIDPSINTPLNPSIDGAPVDAKAPVSVEAIKGYIELAKEEFQITDGGDLTQILLKLSEKVHPLVLGEVYRSQSQIKMLAKKLLANQLNEEDKIEKVISFLCSDSGSHDYTINRREAKNELGLVIDKPDDRLYSLIKALYDDVQEELKLTEAYDPNQMLGQEANISYKLKRGLVESIIGGSHYFSTEGVLLKTQVNGPAGVQNAIHDNRTFDGWRHDV